MEANNQPATEQEKTDKAQALSLDLIKSLDWKVFEALCAAYFKAKGHNAEVSKIGWPHSPWFVVGGPTRYR